MGVYTVLRCPICRRDLATRSLLGYRIGRPLERCACGIVVDLSKTQNEWSAMRTGNRVRIVIEMLIQVAWIGFVLAGMAVGRAKIMHASLLTIYLASMIGFLIPLACFGGLLLYRIGSSNRRVHFDAK